MKRWFAIGIKVVLSGMVFIFLANSSIQYFAFMLPSQDQWLYQYLGLGLTGVGMIGYLGLFLWDDGTKLQKTISITMMLVCLLGELFTAGFGMQVSQWRNMNMAADPVVVGYMLTAIQLLALAHGVALIGYFAGEEILLAWADEDGDGVPNIIDPDYKKKKKAENPTLG